MKIIGVFIFDGTPFLCTRKHLENNRLSKGSELKQSRIPIAVLGQAQLSLSLFELKPRFVKGLKRLEAHFIKMVKSLSLDLALSQNIGLELKLN